MDMADIVVNIETIGYAVFTAIGVALKWAYDMYRHSDRDIKEAFADAVLCAVDPDGELGTAIAFGEAVDIFNAGMDVLYPDDKENIDGE